MKKKANRVVGGYCYYCNPDGDSDAGTAESQGDGKGIGLQIKFAERGIGPANVPRRLRTKNSLDRPG